MKRLITVGFAAMVKVSSDKPSGTGKTMRRKTALHIRLFSLLGAIGLVALFARSAAADHIGFLYALRHVDGA